MRKPRAIGSLVLCLALFPLTAPAGPGPPAQPPQKHRLRNIPATVDVVDMNAALDMALTMHAMLPGHGTQSFEMSGESSESYREEVLAADARGPSAIRRRYTDVLVAHTMPDGSRREIASSLPGKTVTVRRRGARVVVTVAGGRISATDRKELMSALDSDPVKLYPSRPLGPGDTWTVEPRNVTAFPKGVKGRIRCRFEDVVEFDGHPCARIWMTVSLTGPWPELTGTVRMQLSGELHHALDLRRDLAIELNGTISFRGRITDDGAQLAVSGTGTLYVAATYHWLKVGGKPVAADEPAAILPR